MSCRDNIHQLRSQLVGCEPGQIQAQQECICGNVISENHSCKQPPTSTITLKGSQWRILNWFHIYKCPKVKGQEGIGARIWKDLLNLGCQKKKKRRKSADQLKATKQTINPYSHLADYISKLREVAADCIGMGLTLHLAEIAFSCIYCYRVKTVNLIVKFSKEDRRSLSSTEHKTILLYLSHVRQIILPKVIHCCIREISVQFNFCRCLKFNTCSNVNIIILEASLFISSLTSYLNGSCTIYANIQSHSQMNCL